MSARTGEPTTEHDRAKTRASLSNHLRELREEVAELREAGAEALTDMLGKR